MTTEVVYKATCDGVRGVNGKLTTCVSGNHRPDHNMPGAPTKGLAIEKARTGNGYRRPHDNPEVPDGETTHLCCPDCWREYQRWNTVLPIPKGIDGQIEHLKNYAHKHVFDVELTCSKCEKVAHLKMNITTILSCLRESGWPICPECGQDMDDSLVD